MEGTVDVEDITSILKAAQAASRVPGAWCEYWWVVKATASLELQVPWFSSLHHPIIAWEVARKRELVDLDVVWSETVPAQSGI